MEEQKKKGIQVINETQQGHKWKKENYVNQCILAPFPDREEEEGGGGGGGDEA